MRVDLRPMIRADLPLLAGWLREPLVAEWWHEDPEAVEQRYGPSLDGDDPTVLRIAESAGRPVGFVQWFRFADEPEYREELQPALPVPDDAVSTDYLIGASTDRGRGVGAAMLTAALAEIGSLPVVVPVQTGNASSIAVLQRVGFRIVAHADLEPDNPAHTRDHVVLLREPTT